MTQEIPDFPTHRRVNIAYLTSCREIGLDEHVGQVVIDSVNVRNYGYREGNLEHLARLLQKGDTEFSQQFNLTAVIVDDDDEQYTRAWEQNIWPKEMEVPARGSNDEIATTPTLEELTVRIPSQPWKNLRPDSALGEDREAFTLRKAKVKAGYETQILRALQEREVDLVISDSYVTIVGPTLLDAYAGRFLNIHPAITQVGDPDRLPGLTPTRDAYTRAVHGYVIIDDKKNVDCPLGKIMEVTYDGNPRVAIAVPRNNVTGVTVHVMNERLDNGPIVRCHKYRFLVEGITPEAIRTNNYRIKREILPAALLDYIDQCRQAKQYEMQREAVGR